MPYLIFFRNSNFFVKIKILTLVLNVLSEYFWAAVLKNYCHIWDLPTFGFVKFQSFTQNKKDFELDSKNTLLGKFRQKWTFWLEFEKNYCHIWDRYPRIYQRCIFNQYSKFWHKAHFFRRPRVLLLWMSVSRTWYPDFQIRIFRSGYAVLASDSWPMFQKIYLQNMVFVLKLSCIEAISCTAVIVLIAKTIWLF